MQRDIEGVLISEEEIERHVAEIGKRISADFEGKDPIFVGVLKGCFIFMADLMRHVTINCSMDFMAVSSYNGTESSGKIRLDHDLHMDIKDRTVVIVEDVVDTGLTMHYLKEYLCKKHKPKQVLIAALFNKKPFRKLEVDVDFVGKEINDSLFLMGYGLDYNELDRNIPYVYCAQEEDIERMDVDRKR